MAIVGERVPLETYELAGMAALLQRWQREQVKAVVASVVDIDKPLSERPQWSEPTPERRRAGNTRRSPSGPAEGQERETPWPHTGAALAVNERGEVGGSVGRCDTDAIVSAAIDVMRHGRPRLVSFGTSSDQAFSVGLACGETVHVFLEPLDWSQARPSG